MILLNKIRHRIFEILEPQQKKDTLSHLYDVFMVLVILVSLIPLCMKQSNRFTKSIEGVTVIVFIVDYFLRFLTADIKYPNLGKMAFMRYPMSAMAIIDILSILPSFSFFYDGLRALRLFRLFWSLRLIRVMRVLRALKVLRYSKSVTIIKKVIVQQKEALLAVACLALGYIFLSAVLVFNVEPETFKNFFDAFYWACTTLTTVGYGDIYAISDAGRVVTMISSFVGIAIVALPSGIITAGYMEALQEKYRKEDKTDMGEE